MDLILTTPALDVFEQMALDESAVHAHDGGFWLRFYRWTPGDAVTFGYAQPRALVLKQAAEQGVRGPAVRRPTGGGVVFHQGDLTFSCVFRSVLRPVEIYERLHGAVRSKLAEITRVDVWGHTPAGAYAPALNGAAGACFSNPVENDLLAGDGHKILGGAIRRFGNTVLYQGSLQLPGARENAALKRAVITGLADGFGARFSARAAEADLLARARRLAHTCYQSEAWNGKF